MNGERSALGGLRLWPGPCRREKDAALNTTLDPTQRRLVVALAVTLLALPLLVLDLVGGQGDGSSDTEIVATDVPEPSMVVARTPSESSTTSSSTTSTTEAPTSTTAAPVPTTVATVAAAQATTTTTAYVAPQTTTTTAPPAPAPPPAASGPTPTAWESSFMSCVRYRESRGIYTAVDPTGQFMGAYQIYQGGWDAVAASIGRHDLVGVPPHTAAPGDQDTVALAMLRQYGTKPWGGYCG